MIYLAYSYRHSKSRWLDREIDELSWHVAFEEGLIESGGETIQSSQLDDLELKRSRRSLWWKFLGISHDCS